MEIDEAQIVSATEVSRNSGRYITQAAKGHRYVVISNNVPVAGIVGMADLRRLDTLDHTSAQTPPPDSSLQDLTAPPGHTTLGLTSDGTPMSLRLASHTLVAAPSRALAVTLSAALCAANPTPDHDVEFLIATTNIVAPTQHHQYSRPPAVIAVAVNLDEELPATQFQYDIEAELDRRKQLLKRAECGSLTEYRQSHPDNPSPSDLIIAIELIVPKLGSLAPLIDTLLTRGDQFGVHLWLFVPALPSLSALPRELDPEYFEQRVAHRVWSAADSRALVGCADAAHLDDHSLHGYAVTARTNTAELFCTASPADPTANLMPIERFRPVELDRPRLLPTHVSTDQLARLTTNNDHPSRLTIPFGVADDTLDVLAAPMDRHPHLLISGATASGKSTVLATVYDSITRAFPTRDDAAVIVVDPLGTHRGKIDEKNLFAHVMTDDHFLQATYDLAHHYDLPSRAVPTDLDPDTRAARAWWSGPEIFVIIDDYTALLRPPIDDPAIHKALPWVVNDPLARGLHFVIAFDSREIDALLTSDPIIGHLLRTQSPAVMLSGSKTDWIKTDAFDITRFEKFDTAGRGRFLQSFPPRNTRIQVATPH